MWFQSNVRHLVPVRKRVGLARVRGAGTDGGAGVVSVDSVHVRVVVVVVRI